MSALKCIFCPELGRYRCPACGRRTCSVQCCQRHKQKFSCSGERCQTISHTFVPLSKFTDSTLLADYSHLERISRDIDVIRRRRVQQQLTCHVDDCPAGGHVLGRREQFRLRRALARRCLNCRLVFLPPLFERHRNNTTHVDGASGCVMWRVHWKMPTDRLSHTTDRAPDNVRLYFIVEKMLSSLQQQIGSRTDWCSAFLDRRSARLDAQTQTEETAERRSETIAIYRAALETKSLRAFLRVEKDGISNKYKKLNLSRSLCWSLRNQCVIEYPTILLVTSHNEHMFSSTPSRGDDGSEHRPSREVSVSCREPPVDVAVTAAGLNDDSAIYKPAERLVPAPQLDGVSVVARDLVTGSNTSAGSDRCVSERASIDTAVREEERSQEAVLATQKGGTSVQFCTDSDDEVWNSGEEEYGTERSFRTDQFEVKCSGGEKIAGSGFGLLGLDDNEL